MILFPQFFACDIKINSLILRHSFIYPANLNLFYKLLYLAIGFLIFPVIKKLPIGYIQEVLLRFKRSAMISIR